MKKEHYDYISERFNLSKFDYMNCPKQWLQEREGLVVPSTAKCAESSTFNTWVIRMDADQSSGPYRAGTSIAIFVHIPTKELAEEITQHIKDTEILFV